MGLTPADWDRLDGRFDKMDAKIDGVHGRITQHALEDKEMFGVVATSLRAAITLHEEKKHNWGKLFAVLSSILVVAGTVIAGVIWLIERVGNK